MSGSLRLCTPSGAHFVLASASSRRLDLLERIGLIPDAVSPADIDETPKPHERPDAYAERVAWEKANTIAVAHPDAFTLAADTVVASGRRILPKADTETEARKCIGHLSGRRHRIFGAIQLIAPTGESRSRLSTTTVAFKRLTDIEIDTYIASREWQERQADTRSEPRRDLYPHAVRLTLKCRRPRSLRNICPFDRPRFPLR